MPDECPDRGKDGRAGHIEQFGSGRIHTEDSGVQCQRNHTLGNRVDDLLKLVPLPLKIRSALRDLLGSEVDGGSQRFEFGGHRAPAPGDRDIRPCDLPDPIQQLPDGTGKSHLQQPATGPEENQASEHG